MNVKRGNKAIKKSLSRMFLGIVFCGMLFPARAQQSGELGLHLGGTYYLGEMNWAMPFYSTRLNYGAFYKQHINSRLSIKYGGFYTHIQAFDEDSRFLYQNIRDFAFVTSLIEGAAQVEFNFLVYELGETKKKFYTPYVNLGLGACYAHEANHEFSVVIPMGVGIKMNLTRRVIIGAELAYRKTFSDMFDFLTGEDLDIYEQAKVPLTQTNDVKQLGFNTNNDWYSYAAVTLSYVFKIADTECHAYY
ncbi:MAG: DUF6089 family protein [Bacteroidales bacterium]